MDPFLRSPAMHTGLDFRSTYGEPARATAAGTVTQSGWSGGYGKMVEVDHGNGFATRYGHLSSIDVEEGQNHPHRPVVGRVGSTGRSTGPHLHYETRVDGDAVDPTRFTAGGKPPRAELARQHIRRPAGLGTCQVEDLDCVLNPSLRTQLSSNSLSEGDMRQIIVGLITLGIALVAIDSLTNADADIVTGTIPSSDVKWAADQSYQEQHLLTHLEYLPVQ